LPVLFEFSLGFVHTFNSAAWLHACVHGPLIDANFFPSKMFQTIN
jgi:hypothetical protein